MRFGKQKNGRKCMKINRMMYWLLTSSISASIVVIFRWSFFPANSSRTFCSRLERRAASAAFQLRNTLTRSPNTS